MSAATGPSAEYQEEVRREQVAMEAPEVPALTGTRFKLILDFGQEVDAVRRLKGLLKMALRGFGARAITVAPVKPKRKP